MAIGDRRFGSGMVAPITRDGQGDFAKSSGETLLNKDISLLLGINRGELRWDTSRGTRFLELLHRKITGPAADAIATQVANEVLTAHEPRIRVGMSRAENIDDKLRIFTSYTPLGYDRGTDAASVAEVDIG